MGVNEQRTSPAASAPAPPAHREAAHREARPAPGREVRVEIDALVLDGFGPGLDRDLVATAFRAELTRLVERHGVPLAAADRDRVADALTGLPALPATTSPARIGEALARAVHAGLSGRGHAPGRGGRRR